MPDALIGPPAAWLAGLTSDQRAAVDHDGPALLIVAGAGTGKTRALVSRLARLVADGADPDRIMLLTFSRRAAAEMVRRLAPMAGPDVAARVTAGTFHSVAHRLLHRHGDRLGLAGGFSVVDPGDAADLMQLGRQELTAGREDRSRRLPRKETLASVYSRVANSQVPLREVLRAHFPWVAEHESDVAAVFGWYAARKEADRLLDFDDLLLYWRHAMADPVVGPALASGWTHVLVDEYQDTNLLQADIVRALHTHGTAVTAVGDDAQAIYGFRAASVTNMLRFPEEYPGGTVLRLEQNHRSVQPILDLANAVLAEATEGYAKRLWTDKEGGRRPVLATCPDEGAEAAAVADSILELHEAGLRLRDQAVLFRTSSHSALLEVELRRRRVPFIKFGGLRFLEAAHVRDLVAALRVLDNPRDELAWFRLLQLLDGVGPATARRVMGRLGVTGSVTAEPAVAGPEEPEPAAGDPLVRLATPEAGLPAAARQDAAGLAAALADCRDGHLEVGAQVDRLRLGLTPLIERRYESAEMRLRDLSALAAVAGSYRSRSRMTAELTLDPPASTGDLAGDPLLDEDYVTLSTVHSAKGGEWRAVHLIHAADGAFPSDMATGSTAGIEEERRLFYVALTRAREHLRIYAPLRFHHGGPFGRGDRHSYGPRTRFLPPETTALLDQRAVRAVSADGALEGVSAELPGAVVGAMRRLWS